MREPPPAESVPATRPGRSQKPVWQRLAGNVLPCLWTAVVAGGGVLAVAGLLGTATIAGALVAYRSGEPPGSMVILADRLDGQPIDQRWVDIDHISPNLIRAVVMSEDNQFCRHRGIDLRELSTILRRVESGDEPVRGGSTITMQVAKNMFLWKDKSYLRKALELPIAVGMEMIWSKRRILEVYLNIAEWGPGIYGAEAAARHHFRKPAGRLTEREAALLAASLPNPMTRIAARPSPNLRRVATIIERRVRRFGSRSNCALGQQQVRR